jgi:hypothetical protein
MIPSLGRAASDFDDLSHRVVAAGFTAVRPDPHGIGRSTGPMGGLTRVVPEGMSAAVRFGLSSLWRRRRKAHEPFEQTLQTILLELPRP